MGGYCSYRGGTSKNLSHRNPTISADGQPCIDVTKMPFSSWECAKCLNSGFSNAPSRAAPNAAAKNKREDDAAQQEEAKRARMLE